MWPTFLRKVCHMQITPDDEYTIQEACTIHFSSIYCFIVFNWLFHCLFDCWVIVDLPINALRCNRRSDCLIGVRLGLKWSGIGVDWGEIEVQWVEEMVGLRGSECGGSIFLSDGIGDWISVLIIDVFVEKWVLNFKKVV